VADAGQPVVAAALDSGGRIDVAGSAGEFTNSRLAVTRLLPDGRPDRTFAPPQGTTVDELRTLTTPGGGLRTLLRADRIPAAALSPDHRRLALVRSVEGRLELDVVGVDGNGLRQLLVSPFGRDELQSNTTLSWSPDGRRIALDAWPVPAPASCSTAAPRGAGYVIDVAARRLRRLGTGSAPSWSPDGRRIAFEDGQKLVVERSDGSSRRVVGTGSSLSWSPRGSRVAYVDTHQWIVVADADGRQGHRLAIGRAPVWSPGGRRIAYQRLDCPDARHTDCLDLVGPDGGGFLQRASFLGGSLSPASWSQDGTHIALPVWPRPSPIPPTGRPWKIAVVAVKTGTIHFYAVGDAPVIPGAPVQWGEGRTFFFVLRGSSGTS
jgi:Tol biopolymer transport system component